MSVEDFFEDWLECYESNKPIVMPNRNVMSDDDDILYDILSDAYEWLNNNHKDNDSVYNVYHLYTAYISSIILLSNNFNPVTMHDVRDLYVNHYKTVSKAFTEQSEHSQDWLDKQLSRICDVANMFQQKHPEYRNKHYTTNLTFEDICLPQHEYYYDGSDYFTDESESEYDEISDYIDPVDDEELVEKKQVSVQPIVDKLCELLVEKRIYKSTPYVNIRDDPVNGMIHNITEWLVSRRHYENYHIYRIWYVTRMIISNGFHNFDTKQVIEEMLEEWSEHPKEMEKCFDDSYSNEEDHPEIAQINKIYLVLVQFQHMWSCLQNIEFGKIPLFLDVSLKKDYSFHVDVDYNNKDHPVNITCDYETMYKSHTVYLNMFLSVLRDPEVECVSVSEDDVKEFKKYVRMLNDISNQL